VSGIKKNMRYRFQTKVDRSNVYDFLLTHTYQSFSGIFTLLLGIIALALFFYSLGKVKVPISILYLFVACLSVFYMPVFLYIQSKRQMKTVWFYQFPVTYEVGGDGLLISQMEREGFVAWHEISKVQEGNTCLMVYVGKRSAFLWRKEDMGKDMGAICSLLKKYLGEKKVRVKS